MLSANYMHDSLASREVTPVPAGTKILVVGVNIMVVFMKLLKTVVGSSLKIKCFKD